MSYVGRKKNVFLTLPVNWNVCGEMRRIADDIEEAARALLLLLFVVVEPKEEAVVVVIGAVCVCIYFVDWIDD